MHQKLIKLILYLIPFFITFSFRLIFDAYYFNFPFFSIIRGIGSNLVYLSGNALSQISSTGEGLPYIYRLILLFLIISPFLFRLYKLNFKKHIPEYVFLGFTSILFLMNLQLRYFIVIAPILILLLSDLIKKKEFFIHIVISLILILFLVHPYFGDTFDQKIMKDLDQIGKDFNGEVFVVGVDKFDEAQAAYLSMLYWDDDIDEFIWYSDYELSLENKTLFRDYKIGSHSRIRNLRKLNIDISYYRTDNIDYSDVKYLITIYDEDEPPFDFKLVKKYKILRVFQRE
jgi:hypothetical protein